MRDTLIACGGVSTRARKTTRLLELDISPDADERKRIRFDPGAVIAPLLDDLPDALADVLEIAAYVFSADRLIRRGAEASPQIGAEWQRRLRFRIPVRHEALWNSNDVKKALSESLSFLSGDDIDFEFTTAVKPAWAQRYLGFNDAVAQTIRPDLVILFSGGLDSLAGVAESVISGGLSAVLVTHQSANLVARTQNDLAPEIERRSLKGQTFYAPVWVRRGQAGTPVEHTQRLRSFLFASLGMTYARMFGCSRVQFCENGITSFNLPMAQQVIGTRASRTTHPRVLANFSQLFSLLLDHQVSFENPFLWKTKTDIVKAIGRNRMGDLIGLTKSCANVRAMSISGVQCGCCSQCVERQYAMLAAGLDHLEPAGTYERDLFLGAHEDGRDLTMVETHLRRAHNLATMSQHAFLSRYGQVFRTLSDVGGTADEAAAKIFNLHRRYGSEIMRVFNKKSQQNATLDEVLALPQTSLLRLVRGPLPERDAFSDPSEREPSPSSQVASDPRPAVRQRVIFAFDEAGIEILFDHGIRLGRKSSVLLICLAEQFRADLMEDKEKATYAYLRTEPLCKKLKCSDATLRQSVGRIRQRLSKQFEAKTGYTLDIEDIIQSQKWTGYRLNPFLLMVDWRQLQHEVMSRHPAPNVTTHAPNPTVIGRTAP